ncbi:anthranilate 1,2-dioxygenase small subunit AndAd [Solimonas marina]|uniref:Aromatic-ring-hydroxylating dioxygenase subunit beta n=1 Tax=Solimonas marina TaxID=2714601 RepID=A0A970B6H5_9GAMM|nr:anthranilate 1,2-dioxygenase small subunit AndAd [Solimonas marina]NKF22625.1 aromatic-ring-hydroxylating dioxygenase subunit beta [Solimonas marina]
MTATATPTTSLDDLLLWFELSQLQERYVATLDQDRLEDWPPLFTEDARYEIVPAENADAGLPIGVIFCDSRGMMEDRVVSLRNANIYEAHAYRHALSGLIIERIDADTAKMRSSYIVVQTRQNGESFVYQAGRYEDEVVRTADGWRYRSKRAIYDTSRVQTLLATPI